MRARKKTSTTRFVLKKNDVHIASIFKVLSDVNRYRMFRVLATAPQITISELATLLRISVPLASQHLKVLLHAKLLHKKRAGKKVFPALEHNNPIVQTVSNTIKQF